MAISLDDQAGAGADSAPAQRGEHDTQPAPKGTAGRGTAGVADDLAADLALRYGPGLRVFAARRLRDAAEAEDVAQETLRRTLEALRSDRVGDPGAIAGFLYRTAEHVCLHHRRSAWRRLRALARVALERGRAPDPPDPLDALVLDGRRREVRRALTGLEEDDREVLRLAFYEELDTAAMSLCLGASPGAVRVRKHRALRRLAALLGASNAKREEGT